MTLLQSIIGTLALVTIGTAMPQSPAPAADTLSEALHPDEAARRALELCIDHALGKVLIVPGAAQQLKGNGFQFVDEKPRGASNGYVVRALTTTGVVRAFGQTNGNCHVTATGSPTAPIEKTLTAHLKRPHTFAFENSWAENSARARMMGRWRRPGEDLNVSISADRGATNWVNVSIIRVAPWADPH